MSLFRRSLPTLLAVVAAGAGACTSDDGAAPSTSSTSTAIDVIGLSERPASLLVLAPGATVAQRERLERTLARAGGAVLESFAPRLVIAQVPDGADAALTALGVVARFDRAVTDTDVTGVTPAESRFLAVFDARWFPDQVPTGGRLAPRYLVRAPGDPIESAPQRMPAAAVTAAAAVIDPDDQVPVPYASGTVVVSIVLPESNGAVDPSTEDWNEQLIRDTDLKVQAAIDRIASDEPNADLRYIVHYESAPAAGGLTGTVDTAYEFGQRAQWGSSTEFLATADVLAHILGHDVAEGDVWTAALEYDARLKHQYDADAAFFVIVAANGNYTAGLRAHAFINGPWTVLDSSYGYETFNHEFGHIFGALDEYCPDACTPPTALQGYLGMYNANAASDDGGVGIDHGHGENQSSLMQYNVPGSVNGYTRAAWGWLDTDGDGIVEVRDTIPRTSVRTTVTGQRVHLSGAIVDRGESRLGGGVRYSANRIVGLDYAIDSATGPWFRVPLAGDTRGSQAVEVDLDGIRAGAHRVYVRGVSSVGNLETLPASLAVTTTGTGNTAPHLRLDAPARAGTAAPVTVTTTARDLDGDAVTVRYDVDGNGSWDTGFRAPGAFSFTPAAPGLVTVRAQARDARGATRIASAELVVLAGDTAPTLALSNLPSIVHGVNPAAIAANATTADPEGGAVSLNVISELATDDDKWRQEGPAGAGGAIAAALPTPEELKWNRLDLIAGDASLQTGWVRDLVAIDADHLAVAAGARGLWFLDITDRAAPRVMSRLALETSANRLFRAGSRLYVLGTYLTVVDIHDLTAPRELKQLFSTSGVATAESTDAMDIVDGQTWPAQQYYFLSQGAKITSSRVVVTIDHPQPADLTITLVPTKDLHAAPVVLWDHKAATGGLRTFTFTSANTPALQALNGVFADGDFHLEVVDDQANGLAGRLVSSSVRFTTSARAAVVLPNASEIAGLNSLGNLVIGGAGIEVLDVSFASWITSYARLTGTATSTATMLGDTAILAMPLESKDGGTPQLRGLCAVDVRIPILPRVVRCETALGAVPGEHAVIGSRLYVTVQCDKTTDRGGCSPEPTTLVGDARAFARGLAWLSGSSPYRVDRSAIGDDTTVWAIGAQGALTRLDVTNPAALALVKTYTRTTTSRLIPLRLPEVVLFDFATIARTARLGDAWSIVSRVYRITVEARDAAGHVTRASRTVHVVPYDHAPVLQSAAVVPGKDATQPARLHVVASDADGASSWDPTVLARVDWDGDGSFDTDWQWLGNDGAGNYTGDLDLSVPSATYQAVVEVRDGFWARSRLPVTITVP